MKKTFIISLLVPIAIGISSSLSFAQSTSPRFGTVPNDDNTGRTLTYSYFTPTDVGFKDTAKITPHGFETFIQPTDSIKDTIVFHAYNTRSYVCDRIEAQFVGANAGSNKKIIFGAGFSGPNTTISISSKTAYHITFIFDGVAWRETSYMAGN